MGKEKKMLEANLGFFPNRQGGGDDVALTNKFPYIVFWEMIKD